MTVAWLLLAAAVALLPPGTTRPGRGTPGRGIRSDPSADGRPDRAPAGALARRFGRDPAGEHVEGLPLALDLAAGVLRAGRPVPDALELACGVLSGPHRAELERVAALLRLGAAPSDAWNSASRGGLGSIAPVAVRSAVSGVALAGAFERAAAELRDRAAAAAAARSQRAGVQALGPLAACFLPAFVLLGIVPVVVGVAGSVLRSLR